MSADLRPARPRLLIVHSSAELYGSDRSLLDFVKRQGAAFDIDVALPEDGPLAGALAAAGARVHVVEVCKLQSALLTPRGLLRTVRAAFASRRDLRRLAGDRPFDLVYSNSVAILGGALHARRAGCPHVWHVREIKAGSRGLTAGFRALVRGLSSAVIANSSPTLDWIRGPHADARYRVVWNGVPDAAPAQRRAEVRASFELADEDVLFVFVGRLNAWKGQGLLVDAFERLVATTAGESHARLLIVGSAFQGQEHFEDELRVAVERSACHDRIRVLPFRAEIDPVWEASDVVVVPSLEPEPFGRVAIEAMSFGKPVIAAAHGGLLDIVADGATGRLFAPGDANALEAAMHDLMDAPARARMGAAAVARQRAMFSVETYAAQVRDTLLSVLPHRA
jgi:glycosyltransferase involved in cell wall biosynthesis